MAFLIRTDSTVKEVYPAGSVFTLEELYALVCAGDPDPIVETLPVRGYIYVPVDKYERSDSQHKVPVLRKPLTTLWFHEEGKLRNLPVNAAATLLFRHSLAADDYLVGDVLATTADEVD